MVPFERALLSSYRPSIVTFRLSSRISEILPLLCSSIPLFPTPPLISTKFPHVLLGVVGWSLGYEERRCWANCRAISFQDFQPIWSWSTNVTDGWTDRRTTCNLNTALCTIVHRAVKIVEIRGFCQRRARSVKVSQSDCDNCWTGNVKISANSYSYFRLSVFIVVAWTHFYRACRGKKKPGFDPEFRS